MTRSSSSSLSRRDSFLPDELVQSVDCAPSVTYGLGIDVDEMVELASDEKLSELDVEHLGDSRLCVLAVSALAFEADEFAGWGDAGFDAFVVGTHEDLAAAHRLEVDRLDLFAFLAFGARLGPGDVLRSPGGRCSAS